MNAHTVAVSFTTYCPYCGELLEVHPSDKTWKAKFHKGIDVGEMEPAYTQSYYDMYCYVCGKNIHVAF